MADFNTAAVGVIETPFDIAAMLHADPNLRVAWQRRPFYLTTTVSGCVILRYVDEDAVRQPGERRN